MSAGTPVTAAAERDPATRALLIEQAAMIARLTKELHIERARRRYPIPDAALEFITGIDEDRIARQVQRLSAVACDQPTAESATR